jgi:hypothetical protein
LHFAVLEACCVDSAVTGGGEGAFTVPQRHDRSVLELEAADDAMGPVNETYFFRWI